MVQVIWTPRAFNNLQEITFYFAKNFPGAALRFVEKIDRKINLLVAFPEMGRTVPEIGDYNLREIILDRYRIIYEIFSPHEIWITQIHNASREKLSLE